jgi:hypothetical protein
MPVISQFNFGGGKKTYDVAEVGPEGTVKSYKTVQSRDVNPFDGRLSSNELAGLNSTAVAEVQPEYSASESETEIKGQNNARIILGRDRSGGIVSGYGGRGHTRCGAIDLVVGLQGWGPGEGAEWDEETGTLIPAQADKNFGSMGNDKPGDAARIYISQRADIDDYFDICPGSLGSSVAESAVGIKADAVRIMARKGIKLVTGANPPGRNSIDGKYMGTFGIDLIAGNRDVDSKKVKLPTEEPGLEEPYLQPIPKGYNLEEALKALTLRVTNLNAIVRSLCQGLQPVLSAIVEPRMGGNAGGPVTATHLPGSPNMLRTKKFKIDLRMHAAELATQSKVLTALELNYLNPMGKYYINSRYNRTN